MPRAVYGLCSLKNPSGVVGAVNLRQPYSDFLHRTVSSMGFGLGDVN